MKGKILVATFTFALVSMVAATALPYRSYGGKYPYEIDKFDSSVKRHLKQVLGKSYSLYKENSAVEVPCVVRDNFLVIQGCRAHACSSDNSFAVIDVRNGATYAGIASNADTKARKVKVFPAHKPVPALFRRLVAGQEVQ